MSVWDRLIGQDRAREVLEGAAGEPGDSYLFAGPPGVGKRGAALAFAAAILCPERCGACSTCRRIFRGVHPDVALYEPEGFTYPVELVREIVSSAARTPMEGRRRVAVVEEAHRMSEVSQNALLKALEEPSPSLTWVLLADALDPFLPTVLSRCQVIEFASVPEEAVLALLASGLGLDAVRAEVAVRAARGEVDRAVALASDERARAVRALALDAVTQRRRGPAWALAAAEEVQAAALAAREAQEERLAAEAAEMEEVLGTGRGTGSARKRLADRHKRAARRVEIQVWTDFLLWLGSAFRDLAALASGAGPEALAAPDRADELAAAAPSRPAAFWLDMVEAALGAQRAVMENAFPALAVESVLLSLAVGRPPATIGAERRSSSVARAPAS